MCYELLAAGGWVGRGGMCVSQKSRLGGRGGQRRQSAGRHRRTCAMNVGGGAG